MTDAPAPSGSPSAPAVRARWVDHLARALPTASILLLHGVTTDRLLLAAPAALVVLVAALPGFTVPLGPRGLGVVGVAGGLLGALLLVLGEPPPGPFPGVVLSPGAGALVTVCVGYALAGQPTRAWMAAGVLLSVSLAAPPSAATVAVTALVGGALLATAFLLGGARRAGPRGWLVFAAFAALSGGTTTLLFRPLTLAEEWTDRLFLQLTGDDLGFTGLGLQPFMTLQATSRVVPRDRPVLEAWGALPRTLRGVVLDTFDGEAWTASEALAEPRPGDAAATPRTLHLLPYQSFRAVLPAPAGTVAPGGAAFTAGWLVRRDAEAGTPIAVPLAATEDLPAESGPPGPGNLALPDDLATALRPFADTIVAGADDDLARARALERHLSTRHRYALETDLRGDAPPLVVLVRDEKPAWCVYFASAMAAMLRVEGIPSRVVGGFSVDPPASLTGRTLVGEDDAHAWVEAWIPDPGAVSGGRWVAFDPTPSQEAEPVPGLGQVIVDAVRRLFLRLRTHPGEVVREVVFSWPVLAALGLAVPWIVVRWWRARGVGERTAPHVGPRTDPRLSPHHRRFRTLLRRHLGVPVGDTDTDDELLARLPPSAARDAALRFVEAWRRARFGGEPVEDLAALLDALEVRIRQSGP